jgi:hypothetical protein
MSNLTLKHGSPITVPSFSGGTKGSELIVFLGLYRQIIQGDQKVSVSLIITIQKVTSDVQNVPRQAPDIY